MKLRYSKRAIQQIDQALGYVSQRSPSGADKVQRRLDAILAVIQVHPRVGRKTPIAGVRRLYLTPYPYAIDYFATADEIVVLRFRHTARRQI